MKKKQGPLPDLRLAAVKFTHLIGIDPGVKTGFAEYHRKTKTISDLRTVMIHEAMQLVKEVWWGCNKSGVLVRVEDPRQAKFGWKHNFAEAQGAGSVKRDAKIWEDFLTSLGVDFEMVRPDKRLTKLNAPKFGQMTGRFGISSQHARDAAMLVYGF